MSDLPVLKLEPGAMVNVNGVVLQIEQVDYTAICADVIGLSIIGWIQRGQVAPKPTPGRTAASRQPEFFQHP